MLEKILSLYQIKGLGYIKQRNLIQFKLDNSLNKLVDENQNFKLMTMQINKEQIEQYHNQCYKEQQRKKKYILIIEILDIIRQDLSQMETQKNQQMNFQEYVKWAFEENKNTMQNQNDKELLFQSLNSIDGDDMGDVIWLFRKCSSQQQIENQNTLFIDNMYILNHVINFLLTIIHYSKLTQQDITRLMMSIGIIKKQVELQLFHLENEKLLSIEYERQKIQRLEEINKQDFRILFQIIFELKEIFEEEYKQISELRICFSENDQETESSPSQLKQNFGIIMAQLNQSKKNNLIEIEQTKQSEKKQKLQKANEQQLIKNQQQQIKLCKVIYGQNTKKIILLENGSIVTGNIWISDQDQYLIPLSVSLQTHVEYFNQGIEHMNEDQLFRKDVVISYLGPVNNHFNPNVSKAEYEMNILGKLTQNREGQNYHYEGYFNDGFFDGQGKLYIANNLQYKGEYRVGMKHGEGIELYHKDYYLEGNYEFGRKNGVFRLTQKIGDKIWQVKQQEPQILYKNGIEVKNQNQGQGYQFELKKKSSLTPSRILLNYGEYGINNFQLKSLQPGRWLNSSIIDIVIGQILILRFKIMDKINNDYNTVFINCNQFQDIFGSLVTKGDGIQTQIFQQIIDGQKKQEKPFRFVFYFNLDRGHFLSVVYENKKLYLIDSMKDKKENLLYQMKKLLNYFNFQVEGDWQNFQVSQQNNSYDCGIYTIYYISQIIKNIDQSIPKMILNKCFNVEQSRINYVRYLLAKNILQFGVELLQI
ncbi:unnamed protein product [Paramecium primaurelia]|uniref:Ubiquitin-like protease family profile domain-containing protein n=1 Tax=Paramecium primaurelia TaxID=5886 RepID=A0A8S1JPG6_PARPR|nr:unnamed protein product [Paramecium primaurelia]